MKRYEKTPITSGEAFFDPMLRSAMGQVLSLVVEAEAEDHISRYNGVHGRSAPNWLELSPDKRRSWVLETGIGPVEIQKPIICDIRNRMRAHSFDSVIVPRRMRSKLTFNRYLAWKFLQGLSDGDFKECRELVLGDSKSRLPRSLISIFTQKLEKAGLDFRRRPAPPEDLVLVWLDAVDFHLTSVRKNHRLLVACALTAQGQVELLATRMANVPGRAAWAGLFEEMRSSGLGSLPGLVTGVVDPDVFPALRSVYLGYAPQKLTRERIEAGARLFPSSLRPGAKMVLEDAAESENPHRYASILATFVKRYGLCHPGALDAIFGPGDSDRAPSEAAEKSLEISSENPALPGAPRLISAEAAKIPESLPKACPAARPEAPRGQAEGQAEASCSLSESPSAFLLSGEIETGLKAGSAWPLRGGLEPKAVEILLKEPPSDPRESLGGPANPLAEASIPSALESLEAPARISEGASASEGAMARPGTLALCPAIFTLSEARRAVLAGRPVSMETLKRLLGPDMDRIWSWLAEVSAERDQLFVSPLGPEPAPRSPGESGHMALAREAEAALTAAYRAGQAELEDHAPSERGYLSGLRASEDPASLERAAMFGEWLHETLERYHLWSRSALSECPAEMEPETAKQFFLSDRPVPLRSLARLLGPEGVGLGQWMDQMRSLERVMPQMGDAIRARYVYLTGDDGQAVLGHPVPPIPKGGEVRPEESDLDYMAKVIELYADHYQPLQKPKIDLVGGWEQAKSEAEALGRPFVFDLEESMDDKADREMPDWGRLGGLGPLKMVSLAEGRALMAAEGLSGQEAAALSAGPGEAFTQSGRFEGPSSPESMEAEALSDRMRFSLNSELASEFWERGHDDLEGSGRGDKLFMGESFELIPCSTPCSEASGQDESGPLWVIMRILEPCGPLFPEMAERLMSGGLVLQSRPEVELKLLGIIAIGDGQERSQEGSQEGPGHQDRPSRPLDWEDLGERLDEMRPLPFNKTAGFSIQAAWNIGDLERHPEERLMTEEERAEEARKESEFMRRLGEEICRDSQREKEAERRRKKRGPLDVDED
jgi:hypothetical protein